MLSPEFLWIYLASLICGRNFYWANPGIGATRTVDMGVKQSACRLTPDHGVCTGANGIWGKVASLFPVLTSQGGEESG